MTALGMILAGGGLLLVWCGIRDEDPRTIVAEVFTKRAPDKNAGIGGIAADYQQRPGRGGGFSEGGGGGGGGGRGGGW